MEPESDRKIAYGKDEGEGPSKRGNVNALDTELIGPDATWSMNLNLATPQERYLDPTGYYPTSRDKSAAGYIC